MTKGLALTLAALAVLAPLAPAHAADDSKVKAATRQVETGAQKIGAGKVLEGAEETAKGIGDTVVEGARYSGKKLEESGKAAAPPARGVKTFFSTLFGD
jgi:hypothetical protein